MNRRYGILLLVVAVLALSWTQDARGQATPSGAPNAAPPAQPNPLQVNLYDNIERLKLTVDQILPLHGRKVPLAELQKWIGKAS